MNHIRPHYSVLVEPSEEPITYAEAAEHLRVDSTDDEDYITGLISVAREFMEGVTGRACVETQYKLSAPSWATLTGPDGFYIPLYRTPLITVNLVQYYAEDAETLTTLTEGTDYRFSTLNEPGMVQMLETLPSVEDRADAIQITFRAGVPDADDVKPMMKHAIKLMLTHLYEERAAVSPVDLKEIPFSLRNIIANLKVGGWS